MQFLKIFFFSERLKIKGNFWRFLLVGGFFHRWYNEKNHFHGRCLYGACAAPYPSDTFPAGEKYPKARLGAPPLRIPLGAAPLGRPPRRGIYEHAPKRPRKPVFMRVWGLCRKSKCPRPPGTLLPLSCSLGEAGGAGAEPPQSLPSAAAPVQTVLPLKWSVRKQGAGLSNPVPRFRRGDMLYL